jgi:subfamily B ATP-binding cassette protein MsbA
MNTYARLLRYVAPYWKRVVLLLVTITVFAALSGVSLTLITPFLKILLYTEQTPRAGAVERDEPGNVSTTQGIPLPSGLERLKDSLQDRFEAFVYTGDRRDSLYRFLKILLFLVLLKNLFGYAQTYLTEYLEQKVLYRIRRDVYAHIQNLPLSYFDREKTGHIISRITNDVTLLRGAVIGVVSSVIRNSLMTMIAILIILLVSWPLTLLSLVVIPLNVGLMGLIGKRLKRRSHRAQEGIADMTAILEESITGIRVVKAFNQEDFEKGRFDRYSLRHLVQYIKMQMWGALSSPTSELLGTASMIVILWYGGSLVFEGQLAPENLFLFVGAMLWVITPVKNLSKLNTVIQQCRSAAERVFVLLDVPAEPLDGPGRSAVFRESISYENVDFEYVSGEPVLRGVSFTVRPGEVVAVVGPSGAGKSTLVDLLPRFYTPKSGSIRIDGVDIQEMSLRSLRSLMGIVTQDTILFNDSVRNNIAYGQEDRALGGVVEAAKMANAHRFIERLPRGYDTVIGDRGTQLSGGQRQRLASARALLSDPEIVIFDEATSALDTESEMLVQEAIERLLEGRTTIVIAHRLSTIQNADKILVMEDGHLKERGTHSELLHRNGIYRRLYDLQFGLAG